MIVNKYLDPKNDIVFKKIFGSEKNKDILINFLNDVLALEGEYKIKFVCFQTQNDLPKTPSKCCVELLSENYKEESTIIVMQMLTGEDSTKQVQYDSAQSYFERTNLWSKNERDIALKAVVFVTICSHSVLPNEKNYLSRHVVLNKKRDKMDLPNFFLIFIELDKFNPTSTKNIKTMIDKWCYLFKYSNPSQQEVTDITGESDIINRTYKELNQLDSN